MTYLNMIPQMIKVHTKLNMTGYFSQFRSGGVINNAEYGAKSTLTAIMGRMATYTGKEITWDQALNSQEILVPNDLSWSSSPPTLPDINGRYVIPKPGETKII